MSSLLDEATYQNSSRKPVMRHPVPHTVRHLPLKKTRHTAPNLTDPFRLEGCCTNLRFCNNDLRPRR